MYNIIKQIKGDRKGKMKKVLPIILSVFVIISITGNILLYSKLKSANTENQNLSASIVKTKDSISDLENQISEVQADLSDTNTKNEELQSENESLQSEIESLQAELEKLQATGLEETTVNNNSDSQSGSDVASEVQEPAQGNQTSTPAPAPSNASGTGGTVRPDGSVNNWVGGETLGPLEHAESGEGIHAY